MKSIKAIVCGALLAVLLTGLSACHNSNNNSAIDTPLSPKQAAAPSLSFAAVKAFNFSWTDVADATSYNLLENPDGASGFTPVLGNIASGTQEAELLVSLPQRMNAQYILQSCNAQGCTDAAAIAVSNNLEASIGYFKPSNTEPGHRFGLSISLSGDSNTLAVGAYGDGSNAIGVNGDETDNSAKNSGAVYVFTRNGSSWVQQAYVKASNTKTEDRFGWALSLSGDGNTLAVGAIGEDSNATGVGGDDTDNSVGLSGAVYVFSRSGNSWSQQAYVKASNPDIRDSFGWAIKLSGDGNTLAVGADREGSNATGVGGDETNNNADRSGAVYVFSRSGSSWSQQAYVKASTPDIRDHFGKTLSLSSDGATLAVGASGEDSNATGVGGDEADNSAFESGAVYLFSRNGSSWSQQAYVKASIVEAGDQFGYIVSLSGDGNEVAVGAIGEDSSAREVGGDDSDNSAINSGAVYLFSRTGVSWSQQAYLKTGNADTEDEFGSAVSLSGDGNTLAVGAIGEGSNATGVGGDDIDNSAGWSGAVYLFSRSAGSWNQQAYVKASNTDSFDRFGWAVSLSGDGGTLAVGVPGETSNAMGLGGNDDDNSAVNAGAVYLY